MKTQDLWKKHLMELQTELDKLQINMDGSYADENTNIINNQSS